MSGTRPYRPKVSPAGILLALGISLTLWVLIIAGFYLLWQAVGL